MIGRWHLFIPAFGDKIMHQFVETALNRQLDVLGSSSVLVPASEETQVWSRLSSWWHSGAIWTTLLWVRNAWLSIKHQEVPHSLENEILASKSSCLQPVKQPQNISCSATETGLQTLKRAKPSTSQLWSQPLAWRPGNVHYLPNVG